MLVVAVFVKLSTKLWKITLVLYFLVYVFFYTYYAEYCSVKINKMAFKQRTLGKVLTTSNADLYTVPTNYHSEILSIFIANENGSARTVSMDWYDLASTTYFTMFEEFSVAANNYIHIVDSPLFLVSGDKIRGLASAGTSVTVTLHVREEFVPQQV